MSELDANEKSGASLLEILEELSDRVSSAKSMPLSASVLVNKSELLDLLETAQAIVPQQIVDADSVLQDASAVTNQARSDADAIIKNAHAQAQTIIEQAKQKAAQLVARDAITATARNEAATIINEATQKAQHARLGADKYSDKTLCELADGLEHVQEQIDMLQEQIAAGREVLAGRLDNVREGGRKEKKAR